MSKVVCGFQSFEIIIVANEKQINFYVKSLIFDSSAMKIVIKILKKF